MLLFGRQDDRTAVHSSRVGSRGPGVGVGGGVAVPIAAGFVSRCRAGEGWTSRWAKNENHSNL